MPEECLFCKVVAGTIPGKKVYEDEDVLAILDINPRNPGHTLVIPKKHVETIFDLTEEEAGKLFQTVRHIAGMVKAGSNAQGLSISQSNGKAAGQVISHLHFHLIPRFITEAPAGLESILSAKRLDESNMDKIAEAIKGASEKGEEKPLEEKPEEPKEEEEKPEKPEKKLDEEETFEF